MTPSIGDVAELAGVSAATVSRALRGLPNVAPSTRQRVLEAADALGYVADATAARLATGHTLTLGVAVTQLGQWFTSQVLASVEAVMTRAGYDLLVLTVVDSSDRQQLAAGQRTRGRVDGLIAVDIALDQPQQRRLTRTGLPTVVVGVDAPDAPSVGIDNVAAARAATDHLLALGHRRIGLIGHVLDPARDFPSARERRDGYLAGLRAAGLPAEPGLEAVGNFSLEGGGEAAAALLERPHPPTAVFALSDEMAAGALWEAKGRGLPVPEQLSVVGFDDHEIAAPLGLTTVAQPVAEQGERAAELLLSELEQGPGGSRHVLLPTRLVVRETTARPTDPPRPPSCQALPHRS